MKQIELVLQNNGVSRNVVFPCTEAEYLAMCRDLALKDNYAFVRDVIKPKELAIKEDTFVNLDEINYLAKRMDSFDQKELFVFFAAIETEKYSSTKDLINLTFNLNCYTLIRDVSNLKNVGYNYVLWSGRAVSVDELEKMDLEKIGKDLLSSGKGIPTKYGLLFRNENVAFEEVYKSKGFPSYYYTGGEVLGVEVENDGEKDYIYFPCEETEIERALKRIGAKDITECRKTIDYTLGDEVCESCFETLLQKNDTESINAISAAISSPGAGMDEVCEKLCKLSSVMEYAGVTFGETKKVIRLAERLDEFGYYREMKDDEMLGRTLKEQEFCDIPDSMDKYMDYERYAQDFLEEKGGAYTKNGDVVYLREGHTLSEILGENDIKMGGI